MIKAIVCCDENNGIGKNGQMLYHLPIDLHYFRDNTSSHVVVMGHNTYKTLSKPLSNRLNVVLCNEETHLENCICVHNLEDLRNTVCALSEYDSVYIIGGSQVYTALLDLCEEVLITRVNQVDNEAQVFFPAVDKSLDFELVSASDEIADGLYRIRFLTYRRKDGTDHN